MSTWGDLVQDLEETVDDELAPDQLADLWILLSADSGSYATGNLLVALADVDVAVRAMSHVASQIDDPLSKASLRFLRNLVAHSSERENTAWVHAARESLPQIEPQANPEVVLDAIRSALTEEGETRWVVAPAGAGKTNLFVRFLAEHLSPDEKLTAAAEIASFHPDLEREETAATSIRSLLSTVAVRDRLIEELAGEPRDVIPAEEIADSVLRQARIAGEAMSSIWSYPVLEPGAAAIRLGVKPSTAKECARTESVTGCLVCPRVVVMYIHSSRLIRIRKTSIPKFGEPMNCLAPSEILGGLPRGGHSQTTDSRFDRSNWLGHLERQRSSWLPRPLSSSSDNQCQTSPRQRTTTGIQPNGLCRLVLLYPENS